MRDLFVYAAAAAALASSSRQAVSQSSDTFFQQTNFVPGKSTFLSQLFAFVPKKDLSLDRL